MKTKIPIAAESPDIRMNDSGKTQIVSPARGVLLKQRAGTERELLYYLYVPASLQENTIPFVSVHGISRNAREHGKRLHRIAERTGRIVMFPLFSRKICHGYQRVYSKQCHADEIFHTMLQHFESFTGVSTRKIDLFGFSGGAQFAHRYAMLYPERINSLILSSAGWYTFPTTKQKYPYGISLKSSAGVTIQKKLGQFLRLPILVLVGENDIQRDENLRSRGGMDKTQGKDRVERAQNWGVAVTRAAEQLNIQSNVKVRQLPNCGHSFKSCINKGNLADIVVHWLEADLPQPEIQLHR